MPRIKSAKKRVEVTERNRQRNVAYKSAMKTAMKKVLTNLGSKAAAATLTDALNNAYSVIDRAILKGILHKNTGARYKARLAKATNKSAAA